MNDTITQLQIKIAYLEDSLESLNAVIAHQDRLLMDLQDQLKIVYKRIQNSTEDYFDPMQQKPPHY